MEPNGWTHLGLGDSESSDEESGTKPIVDTSNLAEMAAIAADIVVFVIRSDQPLTIDEREFLKRQYERRGRFEYHHCV